MLSLQTIAQAVGLDATGLQLVLSGKALLEPSYLLPLLVYLGCDESEQRLIFHLAEIAANELGPRNASEPDQTPNKQP
jgi:hypothetical protein